MFTCLYSNLVLKLAKLLTCHRLEFKGLLVCSNVFLVLSLSACIGTYQPITDLPLSKYKAVTIISNVQENQIRRQINASNFAGVIGASLGPGEGFVGGSIDALVNHQRGVYAEEGMEAFQTVFNGTDFAQQTQKEIRKTLSTLNWADDIEFIETALPPDRIQERIKELDFTSDLVVTIHTNVEFTPQYELIELGAYYEAYSVGLDGKAYRIKPGTPPTNRKLMNIRYSNKAVVQSHAYGPANATRDLTDQEYQTREKSLNEKYDKLFLDAKGDIRATQRLNQQRIQEFRDLSHAQIYLDPPHKLGGRWLLNDAAEFKEFLAIGIKELAKLLLLDLQGEAAEMETYLETKLNAVRIFKLPLQQGGSRQRLRVHENGFDGKIVSIPKNREYFLEGNRR